MKLYDLILVITDLFITIIYYKLIKVMIIISNLVKVTLNIVIRNYNILDFILND